MDKNTILTIVNVIVIIFIIWLSFEVLTAGIYRMERVECKQWAEDAEEYPDFYYANWQRQQCGLPSIMEPKD